MPSVIQDYYQYEFNTPKIGGRRMDSEEKQLLISNFMHAYNGFDIEGMLSMLHPEIEFKSITDGEVQVFIQGKDEYRILAEQSRNLYSSRKQTVMEIHEKGDQAFVEIFYSSVLAIDLTEDMKAGDTLNLRGLTEFVFQDEKIYRLTDIVLGGVEWTP